MRRLARCMRLICYRRSPRLVKNVSKTSMDGYFSRLHTVYGAIRIVSLITDVFVFYHAKDLRLMDEDDDAGDGSKKKSTSNGTEAAKLQESGLEEKAASLNRAADIRHSRIPSRELAKLLTEMDEVDMQRRGSTQVPDLM